MTVDASAEITTDYLQSLTHTDLIESADEDGEAYVEEFLSSALATVQSFLDVHGKPVDEPPGVLFDPNQSGVDYDPYHREGEVLLFGGPRGILRGGYQYLSHRDYLSKPSLLAILSKGLLHAYNQHLVDEHFERHGRSARTARPESIDLYTTYKMLAPGADEGFTQMFSLYVEGDITDQSLREGFVDEWVRWYRDRDDVDVDLFRAVAYTISDRIEEASGDERDRLVEGLAIQEPLVRDAEISTVRDRLESFQHQRADSPP